MPGNFFGSTLVELRGSDPPAPTLSFAASLALIEAVDVALPGEPLMLKCPNDLLRLGRKLAGILLERSGDRVAVGFGVNLASAPDLLERKSADLGDRIAPQAFAPLIAASFGRILALWREGQTSMLAQAWLARAHPIGTPLTVHAASEDMVNGRFDGIEADGALRLRREDGSLEIVRAGDIEL